MPNVSTSRPPRVPAPHTTRVLLIHPGALGDLVQALPAFAAIRARFADAHIALAVGDDLAAFVDGLGLFDAIEAFDATTAYRGSRAARMRVAARLAIRLRATRPQLAGVFKGAPVYAALARASGAQRRAGLSRGWGARLLTDPIAIDATVHHEDRYLAVAHALGAPNQAVRPVRWPKAPVPPDFAAVRNQSTGMRRPSALVAVAPGGARNAKQDYAPKRWPALRFAAALNATARTGPLTAVLLGGSGDRVEGDALRAALDPAIATVDLIGRTSLYGARQVIAACDAYVGNDSGLMHLAGTTETPIVAVFGPTDPRVLAPRGRRVATLWSPAHSTPCFDEVTGAVTPCAALCCIERVGAAEVADALQAALNERRAEPGRLDRNAGTDAIATGADR